MMTAIDSNYKLIMITSNGDLKLSSWNIIETEYNFISYPILWFVNFILFRINIENVTSNSESKFVTFYKIYLYYVDISKSNKPVGIYRT